MVRGIGANECSFLGLRHVRTPGIGFIFFIHEVMRWQ